MRLRQCRTCGRDLPIRSPAVDCKQCRYIAGTCELYARFMDLWGEGIKCAFTAVLDGFAQGVKNA